MIAVLCLSSEEFAEPSEWIFGVVNFLLRKFTGEALPELALFSMSARLYGYADRFLCPTVLFLLLTLIGDYVGDVNVRIIT